MKALFIVGLAFSVAAISCALEASRAADPSSLKAWMYVFLLLAAAGLIGSWVTAHGQSDDVD